MLKNKIKKNNSCKNPKKCSDYKGYLTLWKEVGETPLEVVENFKDENPKFQNEKFAYAGRLDPMAEGKLLILVGETCKERDKFLNLDKEYEFEILLGFKSDTKDILGLSELNPGWRTTGFDKKWFNQKLKKYIGEIDLEYPVFSSRTVQNKPLFLWALEGRLNEIEIPRKKSEIYDLKLLSTKKIKAEFLEKQILEKIAKPKKVTDESKALGKDFRREEVTKLWKKNFQKVNDDGLFILVKIQATVSSGTYMRTLAEKLAYEILEDYGLAFSIKRTKIGVFGGKFLNKKWWNKKF